MYHSIAKINLQYAHRFLNYDGEAEFLHGHTGNLTIEVTGDVDEKLGFVKPCNCIKNKAWEYLQNFDHALILHEDDPLLPAVLETYEKQGIRHGRETNRNIGIAFENHLAKAYPECRLVVVKKVPTAENLIEIFYSLLKDEFNIRKLDFITGENQSSVIY